MSQRGSRIIPYPTLIFFSIKMGIGVLIFIGMLYLNIQAEIPYLFIYIFSIFWGLWPQIVTKSSPIVTGHVALIPNTIFDPKNPALKKKISLNIMYFNFFNICGLWPQKVPKCHQLSPDMWPWPQTWFCPQKHPIKIKIRLKMNYIQFCQYFWPPAAKSYQKVTNCYWTCFKCLRDYFEPKWA